MSLDEVESFVNNSSLGKLEMLDLECVGLGAQGMQAMASSERFPKRRWLWLGERPLTPRQPLPTWCLTRRAGVYWTDDNHQEIPDLQSSLGNPLVREHAFLAGMYADGWFPDSLVDRVKAVLVRLCQNIEAIRPNMVFIAESYGYQELDSEDIVGPRDW